MIEEEGGFRIIAETNNGENALTLIEAPAVVPYLVEMHKLGYSEYAISSLARFPENDAARYVMMESLKAQRFHDVVLALNVLGDWEYAVERQDIEAVLRRENSEIHAAVVKYINKTNREDLRDLLKR